MSRQINSSMNRGLSVVRAPSSHDGNGASAVAPRTLARSTPPVRECFPATMPLGQFLFEYLYRRGVRHSFGIPGDFALADICLAREIENPKHHDDARARLPVLPQTLIPASMGSGWFASLIAWADSTF